VSTELRAIGAEFGGAAILLAAVVGSGIMGQSLAGGNAAIALLANSLATAAVLWVLIDMLGPVSGAHFNPAVSLALWMDGRIAPSRALAYAGAQLAGAVSGVILAHAMFDQPLLQISQTARASAGQWISELVATGGLVCVILIALRRSAPAIPAAVSLYILAAYWFTASTSFANPAVTLARSLTATFAGIAPAHVPAFALAQLAGALCGLGVARALTRGDRQTETRR
jgi:glycerol uptake facilitator-like aquaporin